MKRRRETQTAMGIAYSCDKDKGVSYEVWEGLVSGSDWVQHVRRQVADRNWPAGDKSLTDVRLVSLNSAIGDADLEEVGAIYRAQTKKISSSRAAVVASKEFRFCQLYHVFTSRHGMRVIVFNNFALACKWLGLDAKDAEQSIVRLRTRLVGETSRQPPASP